MTSACQSWTECPQMSHEQWLEWRRGGVGGSDAPAIMQVSPWSTPYQKWEEKVYDFQQADNSAKRFGRSTEEASRREFEQMMGVSVFPLNIENTQTSWLRASLDGIDLNGSVIVEIKKANKDDHLVATNGKVPEKYVPQCQHIIRAMDVDGMFYFSSPADGSKGVIVEVARDSSYIENELFPMEEKFWNMVLSKTPPELIEKDIMDMSGNLNWELLASEVLPILRNIKTLEERKSEILDSLKSLSQGRSAKGHGIVLQKQICMGAVDYSRVPSLQGVDLSPYRKKSFEKWPIRAI